MMTKTVFSYLTVMHDHRDILARHFCIERQPLQQALQACSYDKAAI